MRESVNWPTNLNCGIEEWRIKLKKSNKQRWGMRLWSVSVQILRWEGEMKSNWRIKEEEMKNWRRRDDELKESKKVRNRESEMMNPRIKSENEDYFSRVRVLYNVAKRCSIMDI